MKMSWHSTSFAEMLPSCSPSADTQKRSNKWIRTSAQGPSILGTTTEEAHGTFCISACGSQDDRGSSPYSKVVKGRSYKTRRESRKGEEIRERGEAALTQIYSRIFYFGLESYIKSAFQKFLDKIQFSLLLTLMSRCIEV